jgi:hypothetical protein
VAKLLLTAEEENLEETGGKLEVAKMQYGSMVHAVLSKSLGKDLNQGDDVYRFKPDV